MHTKVLQNYKLQNSFAIKSKADSITNVLFSSKTAIIIKKMQQMF